ncbi:hypothetical protein BAY60_21520 [Prauserella muralis]|uniref:DUF3558 domain-containing protein n=1 Tax=Prauserella muralis TaxID=588067 RepID=A0A2V4AP09_9PSEU|nr:hypothetical protein BAY60_21520 [Prauserella muralis]
MIIVAAFTVAGLTGCADRPNDLDTYYDETTTRAAQPRSAPSATASRPGTEPAPASPTVDEVALAETAGAAVLTAEDVAAEGVRPAAPAPVASGCLAEVPRGLSPAGSRDARWEYPTGSALEQLVSVYPDARAADVLAARVRCAGQELAVPAQPGIDGQSAWCEGATCAVLLAGGTVLSGIQVTAGDAQRAAEAVRRLAPVAAARLADSAASP